MNRFLLLAIIFFAVQIPAEAGSLLNLDRTKATFQLSDALYQSHYAPNPFQDGHAVDRKKLDQKKPACTVEYMGDEWEPQLLSMQKYSFTRYPNSRDSQSNSVRIGFFGPDRPNSRSGTIITCEKRFDPAKPSVIDAADVAKAFGKNIKFNFQYLPEQPPLLDFADGVKGIRIRVLRGFSLTLKYPDTAAIFSDGNFTEDANSYDAYKLSMAGHDVLTLKIDTYTNPNPASLVPGDELILSAPHEVNTWFYRLHGDNSLYTTVKVYCPRLKQYFEMKYLRSKYATQSQGSLKDLQKAAGDMLAFGASP